MSHAAASRVSTSTPGTGSAASASRAPPRFEDVSPLDGTVIAQVSRGGQAEVDAAVAAAKAAFPGWSRTAPAERAAILQPGRRRGRGTDRGPRAGRDPRQRLAPAFAPARRDATRRDEHPLLRRLPRRAARPPRLRHPRSPQPRQLGPGRRHRDRHAVERAAHARHLAHRPGARSRQHGRRQAAGVGAADRVAVRRHRARGRAACRRVQRRAGPGHRGGRAAGGAPRRAPRLLHRIGARRRSRSASRPRATSRR